MGMGVDKGLQAVQGAFCSLINIQMSQWAWSVRAHAYTAHGKMHAVPASGHGGGVCSHGQLRAAAGHYESNGRL